MSESKFDDAAAWELLERLNTGAYYFHLEPTGSPVDYVLGAVCALGKAWHRTEDWTDGFYFPGFDDRVPGTDFLQAVAAWVASLWREAMEQERREGARLLQEAAAKAVDASALAWARRRRSRVARVELVAQLEEKLAEDIRAIDIDALIGRGDKP